MLYTDARRISHSNRRALLQLRELLLRGASPPGERVSELPLLARLGISRTPIRMTLEKLAHEGLLEGSPSGGFYVCQFNPADIWDAAATPSYTASPAVQLNLWM